MRPVGGQFGGHLVGSLNLPPVPARQFVEPCTGRCGGGASEFGCLVCVLPTPQHKANDRALVVSNEVDRPIQRLQFSDHPIAVGVSRPAEASGCVAAKARQLQGDGVAIRHQ